MGMIDGFAKEHLPQSKALFDYISKLDFESGDYFCFKSGGDGDNGEVLMDYFDHFFAKNCQPAADVVPVVRCSECQYWQPPTYAEQEDGSTVGHCTAALNGQQTDACWFCADGMR